MHKPLKAVVFDWAGTIIDFGSCAPMGAFVELLAAHGVAISIAEARIPMGLAKWDHIHAITQLPRVAAAWATAHGKPCTNADIDELYEAFTPMNAKSVLDHLDLVPGALDTVAALRARGLKIGSTTGYNRQILDVLVRAAAAAGYSPDTVFGADDLAEGRPSPLMMYRTFAELGVWPARCVVKVDDTVPGIAEGRAAACWTVGVSISGNGVGLKHPEWLALDAATQAAHRGRVTAELYAAGCDYVIDSVADLMPVIDAINARLAAGERPALAD